MSMLETLAANLFLPTWLLTIFIGLFGLLIGSFLNVFIYRLHTGKSLNGRSHCMSCGTGLCWFELVPVASYAVLLGRCRTCSSRITPRYAVVEFVTGALFVLAAVTAASLFELIWLLLVLATLVVVTVYDYHHFIIPDELTATLAVLTTGWLGYQWWAGVSVESLLWTVGASMAGAAFFFALWFVSKGRWLGFGDVKLAIPLGLMVGYTGVFSFVVLSFWVGAAISLVLLGYQKYQRGQAGLHNVPQSLTMKSAVPFAPFMIAGTLLVYFYNVNVLSLFSFS